MRKVVHISILARIYGNVNADEVVGNRITIKKMYSSTGEVLPFVSARAIKYAIREALYRMGFEIDPLISSDSSKKGSLNLSDSGRPDIYIDNDLFGYMVTEKNKGYIRRQAPIAISYLKALKDTPIRAEFGGRFPRTFISQVQQDPVPFEVEVADFIGRVNCIIYDNIGIFREDELKEELKNSPKFIQKQENNQKIYLLDSETRKKRLAAFLEVFLTPKYVLPKRTNSLNIPEYIAALVVLSEKGPLPVFQYLDYDFEKNNVNVNLLNALITRKDILDQDTKLKIFLIDYLNKVERVPNIIEKKEVKEVIDEIVKFLIE